MSKEAKCLALIIIIFIAACIETDIYLPAFPDMMIYFSTPEDVIQSLLTWNFFGICISGPFYGPISDSFGRRTPLLIALGLFAAGSVMTLFASTFSWMLVGRLLQGLGSGGCFTLGTAIIFDTFEKEKAVSAISKLNATIPFIMALAPMIGGYLNQLYGFRSNFLAIALFVLASLFICLFFFKESLKVEERKPFSTEEIVHDFKRALTSAPFWQVTLVISLLFAGYLVFVSTSAILFVLELDVPKETFPYFQASVLLAYLVASFGCDSLVEKIGARKVKFYGAVLASMGGLGFVACAFYFPKNAYMLTAPMLIYAYGVNWIMAVYFPEGMEILPDIKGVTASLLTSGRLMITAAVIGISSSYYNGTIYPLAITMLLIMIAVIPTIYFYEQNCQKEH